MKKYILLLLIVLTLDTAVRAQFIIKNYVPPEEQTFSIVTDSSVQKFNALSSKKAIKTKASLTYTWYKYNQIFTTQGGYDGRILNGTYLASYKNNNIKTKGLYEYGLKKGEWYEWYADGRLKEISNWKKGLKNGNRIIYNDMGKPMLIERYKNDLLNGKTIRYTNKGEIAQVNHYFRGTLKPEKDKKKWILAQRPAKGDSAKNDASQSTVFKTKSGTEKKLISGTLKSTTTEQPATTQKSKGEQTIVKKLKK